MVTISGLCSLPAIPKNPQKIVYALAAIRKRPVAPEHQLQTRSTFTKSVIGSWVCSSLGEWTWFLSMLEWRSLVRTTVCCFWLKSYCLSCVTCVASFLSSSKAMFLFTERVGQSTVWNETPAFILLDILPPNSTDLNPIDCKYTSMRELQQHF